MRVLKLVSLASAVMLGSLASPAQSENRSDAFFAALSHVPARLFEAEETWQIEFGDTRAVLPSVQLQVESAPFVVDPSVVALARILPGRMRFLEILDGEMDAAIGIGPADIETILTVSHLPLSVDVLSLRAGAGGRLEQGLLGAGFDRDLRGERPFLWRGAADFGVDFASRDLGNPFGGDLGRSARLLIAGDRVLHAAAWPLTEAMAGEDGATSLAQDPLLQAMGRALNDAGAGQGALSFAFLFRHADGSAVMVADLSDGAALSGLLILSAPDNTGAETLAAALTRNWTVAESLARRAPYAAMFDGAPVISVVAGSPAAVVLRIDGRVDPADLLLGNPVAARLLQLVLADDLGPLVAP